MKKQFLNYPYWRHTILPSAWQILYRPWLISLGLHSLLLIMPLPDHPLSESPKPLREVKITDLPASPKGSTSKPSLKSSTPKPTSNALTPRQDIDVSPRLPKPTPSATPTPKSTPSVTPIPEPAPSVTPTPGVTVQGGELEKFLGELTASNEMPVDKANQPSPNLFAQPRLFFDQLSNPNRGPKPKSDILSMRLIDGKTPVQVQAQVLSSQVSGKDFKVLELGTYGGGTVYKVQQERQVWYFNLVETKGSTGTAIVVWKRDPNRLGPVQ